MGLFHNGRLFIIIGSVFVHALVCGHRSASAQDWSGSVGLETRAFFVEPGLAEQPQAVFSLSAQPEYYRSWGTQSLFIAPFLRLDSADPERTHFDVRELVFQKTFSDWELTAGLGKVFWGVTESQHLVDIINQTDLVENIDSEDKLGQPMVNLALFRSWGNIDVFVLPGFRERSFPGEKGRLRLPIRVATERAEFASSAGNRHVDLAVRWSHIMGDWDVGLSHFYGTGREPQLISTSGEDGEPILIPRYEIIHQTGLDVQATKGSWLWKLELVNRSGQGDRFSALTGGFEYTFSNVRSSGLDIGVLGEYLFDERGEGAASYFEDDFFLATRLEFNDAQTIRVLGGIVIDREVGASFVNVEASRRLWSSWRMSLEVRMFAGIPDDDSLVALGDDDHVQLEIGWYF